MKKKRIYDFEGFVNESYNSSKITEGFISKVRGYLSKFFGWTQNFLKSISCKSVTNAY